MMSLTNIAFLAISQAHPFPISRFPISNAHFHSQRSLTHMSVVIEIPTAFRRFTDGAPKVDCSAATIAEALAALITRYPDLSRHVRDETGQIRQLLNVYLNEEDIRFLGGESCSLKEGDRVLLVPSIAGGVNTSGAVLQP